MAALRGDRRPAPKREAEVIEAATLVFYTHGFGVATVQQVADELGINKGSLYYYLRTKEDLLYRIFDLVHADVEDILNDTMEAEGLDELERIELYVRKQIAYSLEHLERLSVYHQEMDHLTGMRRDEVRDRRRRHDYIVTRLIKDAQAAGHVNRSSTRGCSQTACSRSSSPPTAGTSAVAACPVRRSSTTAPVSSFAGSREFYQAVVW